MRDARIHGATPSWIRAQSGTNGSHIRASAIIAFALVIGGPVAFFLFRYFTGRDPDESPLDPMEWVIAGVRPGPDLAIC